MFYLDNRSYAHPFPEGFLLAEGRTLGVVWCLSSPPLRSYKASERVLRRLDHGGRAVVGGGGGGGPGWYGRTPSRTAATRGWCGCC